MGTFIHCSFIVTLDLVVLSTLCQEKMITEQELKDLKMGIIVDFNGLVCIQCTKPPDVVTRTAELLDGVNERHHANILRGQ